MSFTARPFVLHEANLRQLTELRPNIAVLPWGATETHIYHLPHGTDVVEAALTKNTGVGNPRAATAAKGERILAMLVNAIVPVLVQLSAATEGEFPFVIRRNGPP